MPPPSTTYQLPSAIIRRVRQIEIRTNREVTDVLGGQYHSVFKGRGMEFEEVREYMPGDEVRAIDWNVTARFGHPYIKKFREERELTVMLLVDVSASGQFGSGRQSKNELAAELAAVLAFSAIRNNDKAGVILFTDRVEKFIPPKKGRRHVLRLIREILAFQPAGRGTNIQLALDYLNRVQSRRAVTFLLSDFQVANEAPVLKRLRISGRHHDLVALQIRDVREETLPPVGLVELRDAETGERVLVDTLDRRVRENFAARAKARLDSLRQLLRSAGVDQVEIRTDTDYVLPLIKFFGDARAKNLMEDIRDIKGLVPVPHYGWWFAGLAVLMLVGLAFWLWKRGHPGPDVPAVPPLTPFEAALAALLRLRDENPSVEDFYTRLSDIVRQYLEQQFRLHAPERTTEEFLYELSQGGELTAAQKELLSSFLQESDLVKFAKLRPETADRVRAYDAAEKFVRESVPTA